MSDQGKPETGDEPKDASEEERHAADDPTAVWDAESLRAAGLEDVLERHESEPPPATRGSDAGPSVVAEGAVEAPASARRDATPSSPHRAPRTPQPPPRTVSPSGSELGWGATLALALILGVAVYFAVRLLR